MTAAEPQARRQARSIRNDERILDTAVEVAAAGGWADLLPARVADRAGLSHPAVSARFADRTAIGAGVWTQRLAEPVTEALREVLAAAGLLGGGDPDPEQIARAMQPFVEPDTTMRAAAELLVVSSFDTDVRRAMRESLGVAVATWLTPAPRRLGKADAARRSIVLVTALGSLLEARRQKDRNFQLQGEWDRLCAALAAPDSIETVPDVNFEHWDGAVDFDSGDALLDRLLEATRDEIGRNGYEATTVDDIARAAGRTKGLVFSRYPSKKQLFNDTTQRYTKAIFDLNERAWNQLLQTMSPGAADAVFYRGFMRPGREHLGAFALEQYRLAWHDPDMQAAIADAMKEAIRIRRELNPSMSAKQWEARIFIEGARGVGALLMPSIYPDAWTLPYQHMTVPLND